MALRRRREANATRLRVDDRRMRPRRLAVRRRETADDPLRACVQSTADQPPMSPLELITVVAVTVVVLGGSVFFGLRISRSSMAALREQVTTVNATLVELARRLELELEGRVPQPYRHPVVGDVPGYAVVAGERQGWVLRVAFESDEHSGNFVITLAPRDEQRWPDLGRARWSTCSSTITTDSMRSPPARPRATVRITSGSVAGVPIVCSSVRSPTRTKGHARSRCYPARTVC